MGYVSVVDNGTTIVVTTTSETITFTIATENAILMDDSNPLRKVVKDDVCWWYIYDLRLFCYQYTAGTPGSGMALTTDHGVGFPYTVSGDWDWYPLTAGEETAKADRLAQFQDTAMPAMTTGTEQEDWVLPATVGTSGITHDSGRRIEAASDVAKYTIDSDKARVGHADVVEMGHYTGDPDSPTNHLLCHLKLEENAASANLNDETGNNADGTWSNVSDGSDRNTNTAGDSVSVIGQGNNLDTQDGSGYIEMTVGSGTGHDNDFLKEGSVIIVAKPQFAYTTTDWPQIYTLYQASTERILIFYDPDNNYWTLYIRWGDTITSINSDAYTDNDTLQQETVFQASWSYAEGVQTFSINGKVVGVSHNGGTPTASHPSIHYIGTSNDRSDTCDVIIDSVKTFSAARLPYGAFFTGNGSVDTAVAHSDITAYIKGDESHNDDMTLPTTETILVSGADHTADVFGNASGAFQFNATAEVVDIPASLINTGKGFFCFWFKADGTAYDYNVWIGSHETDWEYFSLFVDYNGDGIHFRAGGSNAFFGDGIYGNVFDENWHHILIRYADSSNGGPFRVLEIDGVVLSTITTSFTGSTLINNLRIGTGQFNSADRVHGAMSDIYFGNDPYTPQISVYMGSGPEHAPMVQVD